MQVTNRFIKKKKKKTIIGWLVKKIYKWITIYLRKTINKFLKLKTKRKSYHLFTNSALIVLLHIKPGQFKCSERRFGQ